MFILPFDSKEATLELAGGKGASLARLFRIGQPVPPGFIITTAAYRDYVSANGLDEVITDCPGRPLRRGCCRAGSRLGNDPKILLKR